MKNIAKSPHITHRAEMLAQWLKALVSLLGDPSLIPQDIMAGHNSVTPVLEDLKPSFGLWGP